MAERPPAITVGSRWRRLGTTYRVRSIDNGWVVLGARGGDFTLVHECELRRAYISMGRVPAKGKA